MGFYGISPRAMTNITMILWKDPPCLMVRSTIFMAIFNSYVKLPEGTKDGIVLWYTPHPAITGEYFSFFEIPN